MPEALLTNATPVSTPTTTTSNLERVRQSVAELESLGWFGDTDLSSALARKRPAAIDGANPATQEFIRRVPGMEHWLTLVPTARALEPLYRPDVAFLPGGEPMTDEMREFFINTADGTGIRNRAAILRNLLEAAPAREAEAKWLSLACGVAQPMLDTAASLVTSPRLTLVDLDVHALADARRYAAEVGLHDRVDTIRMNILRGAGMPLPPEEFDVVEAVGILEYLRAEDWAYQYHKVVELRRKQAGAATLLRNAWRHVRPGGSLIVGNMLVDRPELAFVLNVVQWPHIQPRTIDDVWSLFDAAGVEGTRDAFVADDPAHRVYAIYRVVKPVG